MTLEEVIVAGQPAFIQMTGGLDFALLDKLGIDIIDLLLIQFKSIHIWHINVD
jgi:hypothetical protein